MRERKDKMGRKLDLGELGDAECEHILEVLNRDFRLRQQETERLQQQEKELKEEALKTALLEKQRAFNQQSTCIRCLDTFPVLSYWKLALCYECNYNVCRSCSEWDSSVRKRTCLVCVKTRDLRVQTLSWFYDNVKARFRRYGSAKVIRSLYKRKSGTTSDSEYDSGYDPSQASTLSQSHQRRLNGASRNTPRVDTLFTRPESELGASVEHLAPSSDTFHSSLLEPRDCKFPVNANIHNHVERFHDDLRGNIEELREALADFLTDDDFESDRFKRMLYTFSFKFCGILKTLEAGLKKDIPSGEGRDVDALASETMSKQVENLVGIELEIEALKKRDDEDLHQYIGGVIVYKVMNDFKQEASDYCEILDKETEESRGDGSEDLSDKRRKESVEFHQMEARFQDARNRPSPLPSFGSVDFDVEASDGDINDNFLFVAKPRQPDAIEAVVAAEAVARDLDAILDPLPETDVDKDDDSSRIDSRRMLAQHVNSAPSSDENELEDIMEEEESEEDEEGKEDTVKEKIVRRSVEGSDRDTASEDGDDLVEDPFVSETTNQSVDDGGGDVPCTEGDVLYNEATSTSSSAHRLFDHTSSMYVPVPDKPMYARIGSRDAINYSESIDSNLSRTSSLDESEFMTHPLMMTNSNEKLKALSSEIIQRFSQLDAIASESEDEKSPREPENEGDHSRSTPALPSRDQGIISRISNPSSEDPKFIVIPEDLDVRRGEEARWECSVEGTLPLDVFWFADENGIAGQQLEESVKYSVETVVKSSSSSLSSTGEVTHHLLRIFDVNENDAGRYYCVCVNAVGRNASIFRLSCRENPRLFKAPSFGKPEMANIHVTEGEAASFMCRVTGYPKPRLVFQRRDDVVLPGIHIQVSEIEDGVYQLKFDETTQAMDDRYVAFAVNAAGDVECSAELMIDPKPSNDRRPSFSKIKKDGIVAETSPTLSKPTDLVPSPPPSTQLKVSPGAQNAASELEVDVDVLNEMAAAVDSERRQIIHAAEELVKGKIEADMEQRREEEDDEERLELEEEEESVEDNFETLLAESPSLSTPSLETETTKQYFATNYDGTSSLSVIKGVPFGEPSKSDHSVDPLAALRPSSRPSSASSITVATAPKAVSPRGDGSFIEIDEVDDELPGTQDLRGSFARNNSSRTRFKRDYYINRKSTSSVMDAAEDSSTARTEAEDDLSDLYVIPSSGHDKYSSYVGLSEEYDYLAVDDERRFRGDGSSSFGSSSFGSHSSAAETPETTPLSTRRQPKKKALPSVKQLSAIFDRGSPLPTAEGANPVVEEFLRFGSITGRSLQKKGRDFFHDVVRPSSAASPIGPSHHGSGNSSLASSLRSSIRSLAGLKVSNVDEDPLPSKRPAPDGASVAGEDQEEEEKEEENAIFV